MARNALFPRPYNFYPAKVNDRNERQLIEKKKRTTFGVFALSASTLDEAQEKAPLRRELVAKGKYNWRKQ